MRIIVLGEELSRSWTLDIDRRWLIAGAALLFVLLLALITMTLVAIDRGQRIEDTRLQVSQLQQELLFDQQKLQSFYAYADGVFVEHAKRAGQLQARLARLEALGARLADVASLDDEFDFYSVPAIGGPSEQEPGVPQPVVRDDVLQTLDKLALHIDRREHELKAIDGLLANRHLQQESYVAGRPVNAGWLSSHYGKRIDPFDGHAAWHGGVDFAGKLGADILAVASGVVVWSGDRYGYGQMVEVNHGNGFVTRYAHNLENKVKIGDVVSKGQVIALMGSSGRSTGPHVHFEVLHNGRTVDPRKYIYRKQI
ncbi:MAG TPA: M23 family metallopeptidase [Pseudomonadales bacterium]